MRTEPNAYRVEKNKDGGIDIWFGEGSQIILTKRMVKELIEEYIKDVLQ